MAKKKVSLAASGLAHVDQGGPKEVAIVAVAPKRELVLEGDPDAQLAFAGKAANALMRVVKNKPRPVMIQGKQYLEYGDWQVLARFYGATVEIEWTKPLLKSDGKIKGYEARALVKRQGEVISSAEGMCTTDENRWGQAEEYAVRSMAQTRTAAKALRNAFGWVAELAGYSATPAEEMPQHAPMPSYQVKRVIEDESDEAGGYRHVPVMDETNDASGLDAIVADKKPVDTAVPASTQLKMKLATLLREKTGFTTLGKSAEQYREAVLKATGMDLTENNYLDIIDRLKNLE